MCADVSDDDYEEDDYSLDGFDYERIYQKVREDNKKAEIAKELEEKQARKLQEIANLLREIPERERRFLNNEIPFHEMTMEEQKIAAQDPSLQPTSEDNPDWYKQASPERKGLKVHFKHTAAYEKASTKIWGEWEELTRDVNKSFEYRTDEEREYQAKMWAFFDKRVNEEHALWVENMVSERDFQESEDYYHGTLEIKHQWHYVVKDAVVDALNCAYSKMGEDDYEENEDYDGFHYILEHVYERFFQRGMQRYRDIYFDKIQRLNREYEAELECQQEQMTEKNGTTGSTKNIGT